MPYVIQILERDPKTDLPVIKFSKKLYNIPVLDIWIPQNQNHLLGYINGLNGYKWYEKDAMKASVWFLLNLQFPNHLYKIELIQNGT